jgi:hypothetical protein
MEYDAQTGLYYDRARVYDPMGGRFYSQDPAGQGPNPYTYAGNGPTDGSDPSGKWFFVPAKEEATWGGVFGNHARLVPVDGRWLLAVPKRTKASHDAIVQRLAENNTFPEAQMATIMIAMYGGDVYHPTGSAFKASADLQDHPGGNLNVVVQGTGGPATNRTFARIEFGDTFRSQAEAAYEQAGGGNLLTDDPKVQQLYAMAVAAAQQEQAWSARQPSLPMMTAVSPAEAKASDERRATEKKRRKDEIRDRAFRDKLLIDSHPGSPNVDWDVIEQQRQIELRDDAEIMAQHGAGYQTVDFILKQFLLMALTDGLGRAWDTPGSIWGVRVRPVEIAEGWSTQPGVRFEQGGRIVELSNAEVQALLKNPERLTSAPVDGFARPRFSDWGDVNEFTLRNYSDMVRLVEDRMHAVGVPERMIGILDRSEVLGLPELTAAERAAIGNLETVGRGFSLRSEFQGGRGVTLVPRAGAARGAMTQVKGGINVDGAIFDDNFLPFGSWRNAKVGDRLDAIIAHEYEQVLSREASDVGRHFEALSNGPRTQLNISEAARTILADYKNRALANDPAFRQWVVSR